MKETAVEQLLADLVTGEVKSSEYYLDLEKQQIIDSAKHGANYDKSPYANAEDYYTKTYGRI